MANPLSAAAFLSALEGEGLVVVQVGDWRDHNRNHKGPWGPVHGVMIHHTVTKGSKHTVELCRHGYTALPGPLCHGVITKDGRVHLVGYGRANHAGSGDDDVLKAVIAEKPLPADNEANTDGNRHFYGFECENLGDGDDPWPAVQIEAIVRAATAVCRLHGWNERSVIAHEEWQPGKVDPRGPGYPGHGGIRSRVAARLKRPAGATPPATPPKEDDVSAYELWSYKGRGEKADAYHYLRSTNATVKTLTTQVAALTATVTKLAQLAGTDVDTEQVVAAVREEIRDAVVKVDVDITSNQEA